MAFGHDLIREAVRASSPVPVRRALDRQAADVLLARGALPVEAAEHLAESAEPGDETAIATLLQAADALRTTDPGTAAKLAGRALELAPPRHSLRGPLVARRAISLFAAGLGEEGRRCADTALRQALPAEEEARVRITVASMFDISPDLRADNARAALALPDLTEDVRAWLWRRCFTTWLSAVVPKRRWPSRAKRGRPCIRPAITPAGSRLSSRNRPCTTSSSGSTAASSFLALPSAEDSTARRTPDSDSRTTSDHGC